MSDEGLHQYFDECMKLYKYFVKQSSVDDRHSLCIVASGSNNAIGNKSFMFPPEDCYYVSNEWYAISKNDKYKVLKALSVIHRGNKASKPGGYSKSGDGINNGQGK